MDWAILGCGYVGGALARALLHEGATVRVGARDVARLEPLGRMGAQVVRLDATRARAFGPALYGLRSPVVVYSIPPLVGLPPGEGVRRATEAARAAGASRFIYLGSTSVYGETEHGATVDEDSPVAPLDAAAAPRITEETAVETARLAGLSTVILRLAAIYGPGRGVRERLRAGSYQLVDDGIHFFSRVHVDDLVGIIRAAAGRAPPAALYCVADDSPSTQREYVEWLCARMGVPVPPSVESLAPGRPRRAVRNRKVSNARLHHELGYAFLYPGFREGEAAIERAEAAAAAEAGVVTGGEAMTSTVTETAGVPASGSAPGAGAEAGTVAATRAEREGARAAVPEAVDARAAGDGRVAPESVAPAGSEPVLDAARAARARWCDGFERELARVAEGAAGAGLLLVADVLLLEARLLGDRDAGLAAWALEARARVRGLGRADLAGVEHTLARLAGLPGS